MAINEKGTQAEIMYTVDDEQETILRLRDAGCDNIATDKLAFYGDTGHIKTYVKHVSKLLNAPSFKGSLSSSHRKNCLVINVVTYTSKTERGLMFYLSNAIQCIN